MKRYQAVLLDMFDTLVNFHWDRLPLIQLDGQDVRTTSPLLYECFRPDFPSVSCEDFCRAFVGASRTVQELRNRHHREITARERFQRFFDAVGYSDRARRRPSPGGGNRGAHATARPRHGVSRRASGRSGTAAPPLSAGRGLQFRLRAHGQGRPAGRGYPGSVRDGGGLGGRGMVQAPAGDLCRDVAADGSRRRRMPSSSGTRRRRTCSVRRAWAWMSSGSIAGPRRSRPKRPRRPTRCRVFSGIADLF